MSDECARSAHLDSLRNEPTETPVRLFTIVSEQPGECAIRASGRWIFRDTAQRCEHASTNVKTVAGVRVKVHIGHDILSSQGFKSAYVDARAFEDRAVCQLNHDKGKPNRRDLRTVRFGYDVFCVDRNRSGHELGGKNFSERKRLRSG